MGKLDQVLRAGIGLGLIWFGFFDHWFIHDPVAGAILGAFGIVNLLSASLAVCPVYLVAGINTRPLGSAAAGGAIADSRRRILAATVGLSVLVLAIFGVMAYRIADDASAQHAPPVMIGIADRLAETLERMPPGELASKVAAVRSEHAFFRLHGADGQALFAPTPDAREEALWRAMAEARARGRASFEFGDERYFWVSKESPTGRLRVTLVEPSPRIARPILESLAVKLGAMGLIVVWIAVWAALIISSTMGRKLDEQNAALMHQAQHDDLTGLPNRALLRDRLEHGLRFAARERQPFAILIMDLDRFKEVNDTLGHSCGDELLKEAAARLKATLRASDTCARLGGDEFSILLPNTSVESAVVCVEKIREALDQPVSLSGVTLQLRASIGVAVAPDHGNDADALIRHADVAMYDAKRKRAEFAVYAPESDPNSLERLTLASDLRAGIEQDQLELEYQPKLCLKTSRLVGVEALVRWRHPTLGEVPPDKFIHLAEQNGLINELTRWVLRDAIAAAAKWYREGLRISVAVNLSPLNLLDSDLPSRIAAWLDDAGLPPDRLELELTESAAMGDVSRAAAVFERLVAMGIRIAIDDFGTGMSSLSYLKRLPVHDIKIDRTFVSDMLQDEHNAVLVRSIIDLSHNLGRCVIAEGIEDAETLARLQALGCDGAQGYFIGRPLPAGQVAPLFRANPARTTAIASTGPAPASLALHAGAASAAG